MENTEKRDLLKEKTTKIVKYKEKEISVSIRKYGSYTVMGNPLYVHKGYKSNIYYLIYSGIAIMNDKNIGTLLDKFDKYISKIDGLDNKVMFLKNLINK